MLFIETNIFFLLDFRSESLFYFRGQNLTWGQLCNHGALVYHSGERLHVTDTSPPPYLLSRRRFCAHASVQLRAPVCCVKKFGRNRVPSLCLDEVGG